MSSEPIRILHLSDLHITDDCDIITILRPLIDDLNNETSDFKLDRLDYLVITGDVSCKGRPEEFEKALEFINGIISHFRLTTKECIIVPGNHDLFWNTLMYELSLKNTTHVGNNDCIHIRFDVDSELDDLMLNRTDKYHLRFDNFSKCLYSQLTGEDYPPEYEKQFNTIFFPDSKVLFLALNSCWEIDIIHRKRASINQGALLRGLDEMHKQIKTAEELGHLKNGDHILKIAIWHHPITGNDKIIEDKFVKSLIKNGFKLCLHGHIHEDREDTIGPFEKDPFYIAGTGSFGAPLCDRPSVPRLYNLLEIDRQSNLIKIHVRELEEDTYSWTGRCKWATETQHYKRSYFEIPLVEQQDDLEKSSYKAEIERGAQMQLLLEFRKRGIIDDKTQMEFSEKINTYSLS